MNSDSKTKIDLLDRKGFADEIAKGIIESAKTDSEGFVIGLTGKWGSGKSTLLDFVKDEVIRLSTENNISNEIIEFNPWMFTDEENIKKAFLKEFANKISNGKFAKFKRKSSEVLGKVKGATEQVVGKVGGNIIELIQDYIENGTSIELKNSIDKRLLESNKKIFIFIDDIDRLLPKQIFEILQVLKLSGNFKNTYYVIAFDREAVEISIESQFKDYGRKYLDKIIQADFLIPEVLNEKIEEIFFKQLDDTLTDLKINYSTRDFISVWSYRGFKNYFTTLREVYRYFNSLKLRLPAINNNVNITDFLIIEAIRLYDFIAYEKIYQEYSFSLMSISSKKPNHEENQNDVSSKQHTKSLIKYLFSESVTGLIKSSINEKRLNDPIYFHRYFTLKINSNDIGESDLRIIIEEKNGRSDKLNYLFEHGRMGNLLRRLNDKDLLEHYPYLEFNLIVDLFDFFDENAIRLRDLNDNISDAIMNLLEIDERKRKDFFEKFLYHLTINHGRVSNARGYFMHFILLNKTRNTGFADNFHFFKNFIEENINQIEKFYSSYLYEWKSFFLSTSFPNESYTYYTLIFTYDYASFDKKRYSEFADLLLENKKALLFYLEMILRINATDNIPYAIEMEKINLFLPDNLITKFISELNKLNDDFLEKKQIMNKDFFLTYYQLPSEN
jgi:KAP family P-loop domain